MPSTRLLLIFLLCMTLPVLARPFLRVDLHNGEKVPPQFQITGKTSPGCIVLVDVSSWDGFGAQFEVFTDRRGNFSLPVTIEGRTVTTHVDILVRAIEPRRGKERKIKRYVILRRKSESRP